MKKNIIITILVIFVVVLGYLFINKKEILHQMRESEKIANIGNFVSNDLTVFDKKNTPHKLKSLIGHPTTVFLYSESCPPCQDAISGINHLYKSKKTDDNRKEVIVVLFDDEMPNKVLKYEHINAFYIKESRGGTIFDGYQTPVFYHFDREAKLMKKNIGWSPDTSYLNDILRIL